MNRFLLPCMFIMAAMLTDGAAAAAPDVEALERDLALELRLLSPAVISNWKSIEVEISIVNRSKDTAYHVVLPGDGSWADWREPYIYYTAERQLAPNGDWVDLPRRGMLRCGLYDADWRDEVVFLAPGESAGFHSIEPRVFISTSAAGTYRLRAHYEYKARPALRSFMDRTPLPEDEAFGMLRGYPPIRLVSNTVEFRVQSPLRLIVTPKRDLIEGQPARFSDLVDIALRNDGDQPIEIASTGRPALQHGKHWPSLRILSNQRRLSIDKPTPTHDRGESFLINPGESISLVGDSPAASGHDAVLLYDSELNRSITVPVFMLFRQPGWRYEIPSEPIELVVRPGEPPS